MKRRRTLTGLVGAAMLVGVVPAWGHATLDQGSVPRDSAQALTMRVPVEPNENPEGGPPSDVNIRHNVRVTVEIPGGFTATGCEPKPGWVCAVNPVQGGTPHHVAYDRQGPPYEGVDVFHFTVRTPATAGEYPFETNQTYSEGDVSHWDGPPDSPTPAPVLRVE